jgi:hypothetical protein
MKRMIQSYLFIQSIVWITSLHAQPSIVVSEDSLIVNGHFIQHPWRLTEFMDKNALAKFDKFSIEAFNDAYTYDKAGIVLFSQPHEKIISEFQLYYRKNPNHDYFKSDPSEYFNGSFLVNNCLISSNTSFSDLKKGLPQFNFIQSNLREGTYLGKYKGWIMYVCYELTDLNIWKICIGKH